MIKAVCGELVLLGLSHRNLDRLRNGEPIKINGGDLGLKADIVIFAGKTEQTMHAELEDLIGPDTKVHIDPRLRS